MSYYPLKTTKSLLRQTTSGSCQEDRSWLEQMAGRASLPIADGCCGLGAEILLGGKDH